jgi:hypothetical protein
MSGSEDTNFIQKTLDNNSDLCYTIHSSTTKGYTMTTFSQLHTHACLEDSKDKIVTINAYASIPAYVYGRIEVTLTKREYYDLIAKNKNPTAAELISYAQTLKDSMTFHDEFDDSLSYSSLDDLSIDELPDDEVDLQDADERLPDDEIDIVNEYLDSD